MEVYMDDITVYGGDFEKCLTNLEGHPAEVHKEEPGAQLGEVPFHG